MRLPLGILTGVGFIGGGAILRKGSLVSGITTAGTLWVMTVIGLCFGGGQLLLGCAATVLTLATLVVLKKADRHISRELRAAVVVSGAMPAASVSLLERALEEHGYRLRFYGRRAGDESGGALTSFEVSWKCREADCAPLALLALLESQEKLRLFELLREGLH